MAALTSPSTDIGREFAQQMDNLEILAGEVDQVVDLNAEVEKAIEEGDQFVSPETVKLHNDFKNLAGKFESGDAFGAASLRDNQTKLQTSQSVDQFFKENNVLSNIEGELLKTAGIDDSRADQFRTTTRYTEDFTKGARAQAKAMKNNVSFRNREDLTEEDIFNRIMALKGRVDKRTASVKAKPKSSGFTDKSQVPVSSDPKVVNVGSTQFSTENSTPFSQQTQNKPVISTGVITIDSDGSPVTREGQVKMRPVELGVVTSKDGVKRRVMFAKEIIDATTLSRAERKSLGLDPESKQKTVEKDIVVDYDNIENTMLGQSVDAKSTAEAFNDVSQDSKRRKMIIDDRNFDSEYEAAFRQSGFNTPQEFNQAAASQGIDIVFNEDSEKRSLQLLDPLNK